MKNIYLTFLFLLFTALSYSQYVSPFTVEPKLDTAAKRLRIQSITYTYLKVDSLNRDSTKQTQTFYNADGYPIKQIITEYKKNFKGKPYTMETGIMFEYNENGYVIAKKTYGLGGPIGTSGSDSIFIQTHQRYVLINDKKVLLEEKVETEYVNEETSEQIDTYVYDSLGVLQKIKHQSSYSDISWISISIDYFEYFPNDLLKNIIGKSEGKTYSEQNYSYTFFNP